MRRIAFRRAFVDALRQSPDITPIERFKIRIITLLPGMMEAIQDFVAEEMDPQEYETVFGGDLSMIDLDNLERLLQLLIEYLPQLLEIILPLFS